MDAVERSEMDAVLARRAAEIDATALGHKFASADREHLALAMAELERVRPVVEAAMEMRRRIAPRPGFPLADTPRGQWRVYGHEHWVEGVDGVLLAVDPLMGGETDG